MTKDNSKASRERRNREAVARDLVHDSRSDAAQIAELDRRLGVGVGAVRERAYLAA